MCSGGQIVKQSSCSIFSPILLCSPFQPCPISTLPSLQSSFHDHSHKRWSYFCAQKCQGSQLSYFKPTLIFVEHLSLQRKAASASLAFRTQINEVIARNVSHLTLIITYMPISPTELEQLVIKAFSSHFYNYPPAWMGPTSMVFYKWMNTVLYGVWITSK